MSSQGVRPKYDGVVGQHAAENRPLTSVRTRQQHIANIAERHTDSPLTTLNQHLDMLWMHEAFSRVRKDCATGIDGVTAEEYAQNLDANLADLLERAKSGRYRSSPTRRVHIPKNQWETRPISIPTFEDKVLQRAVAMLLEPIYETDFLDCSYGFRPRRSAHQAMDALRICLKESNGGWVVDVDVRKYFDTIPHAQLKELLRNRVNDSVILRLIAKWLSAGALDKGTAHLIRFADDFVVVFDRLDDAQRFLTVLPKRFEKYGLQIHPDKTKMVDFCHPWDSGRKPETFDFLGFTHYWGKTKKGGFAIKKKTSSQKMRAGLKKMHEWCKKNRHKPVGWQHEKICQKLQGHYAYYGVTTNSDSIGAYRCHTLHIWRYWLNRRSRKRDGMGWKRFQSLLNGPYRVPYAHIVHKANRNPQLCLSI